VFCLVSIRRTLYKTEAMSDDVIYALLLIGSVLLGFVVRHGVTSSRGRQLFVTSVGVALVICVCGWNGLHSVVMAVVTAFIVQCTSHEWVLFSYIWVLCVRFSHGTVNVHISLVSPRRQLYTRVIRLIHSTSVSARWRLAYIDGRSQIKVHTDERTRVHSARFSPKFVTLFKVNDLRDFPLQKASVIIIVELQASTRCLRSSSTDLPRVDRNKTVNISRAFSQVAANSWNCMLAQFNSKPYDSFYVRVSTITAIRPVDGRSQIKVYTDERTQVHSAQYLLLDGNPSKY